MMVDSRATTGLLVANASCISESMFRNEFILYNRNIFNHQYGTLFIQVANRHLIQITYPFFNPAAAACKQNVG